MHKDIAVSVMTSNAFNAICFGRYSRGRIHSWLIVKTVWGLLDASKLWEPTNSRKLGTFPSVSPEPRKRETKAVGNRNQNRRVLRKKDDVLRGVHFTVDSYIPGGTKKLKPDAIPTIFAFPM